MMQVMCVFTLNITSVKKGQQQAHWATDFIGVSSKHFLFVMAASLSSAPARSPGQRGEEGRAVMREEQCS